tara:strand:+ start:785 stop:1255 length:471 start_codon:yes stop_codon:yes gene_type:complete
MPQARIPGAHHRRFTVTTALPSGKTVTGDDGMPLKEWSQAGDLLQRVTYTGDLERLDGRWSLVLQWVDLDNAGHRIALPHEVVSKILSHGDNILKAARSDRAKAGAETRRARTQAADSDPCTCEHPRSGHDDEYDEGCEAMLAGGQLCPCEDFKAA